VDTEIEISDLPTGRCCEITQQRDPSTKSDGIGFRLDPVAGGFNKWGSVASICVVMAADATEKKITQAHGQGLSTP
jgi:hypothetical protein